MKLKDKSAIWRKYILYQNSFEHLSLRCIYENSSDGNLVVLICVDITAYIEIKLLESDIYDNDMMTSNAGVLLSNF